MNLDITAYGDRRTNYDSVDWGHRNDEEEASIFLAGLSAGRHALELGIGTGRVALPLARHGLKVVGIESSRSMLEQLDRKLGGDEMRMILGDFADLPCEGNFDLIYCVSETFFLLPTQEKQLTCMKNVAAHLAPGGRFVIQAFVPDHGLYCTNQRTTTRRVNDDSVVVTTSAHNRVEQRVDAQDIIMSEKGNEFYPMTYRYAWPPELDLMAQIADLALIARFDGWRNEPYTATGGYVSVYGGADQN